MSEVLIYENHAVKAARLERENLALRSENARLRAALGEQTGEIVASQVTSTAPKVSAQTTFQAGACSVTIGRKAGGRQASAIPALEQQPGETHVQIYNAAQGAVDPVEAVSPVAPARAVKPAAPVRRPNLAPPGGGMATFDLAAMRPTPVRPRPMDDSEQRFSMLEIDEQQKQGQGG